MLGSTAPVIETADDAVGVLRLLPAPEPPVSPTETYHVNLHYAEHDWVSERPQAGSTFTRTSSRNWADSQTCR